MVMQTADLSLNNPCRWPEQAESKVRRLEGTTKRFPKMVILFAIRYKHKQRLKGIRKAAKASHRLNGRTLLKRYARYVSRFPKLAIAKHCAIPEH